MNRITAEIQNLGTALADIDRYSDAVKMAVRKGIARTTYDVQASAQAMFEGNQEGDSYSIFGLRPHVRTAILKTGIKARVTPYEGEVSSDKVYSASVEFGQPSRNIRPHPFMNPAAEENRDKHRRRMKEALKK